MQVVSCLRSVLVVVSLALLAACGGTPDVGPSVLSNTDELSGCNGRASSALTVDGNYYLTTFGDGATDNGQMSCGEYTEDGSWYYAASRQRFGCGSHIRIEAGGACVVAETDDYGPDVCVETAAGKAIIDASPLVSLVLFGTKSAGWSEHRLVHVTVVDPSTPLGPCAGSGASADTSCASSTLDADVPTGTCVQAASDAAWYHCVDGEWLGGKAGCTTSYAWCHSATLGADKPPRTCVQAASDGHWYQCTESGWERPVSNGAGPLGTCSAMYSL